jgi:hypothetical protein
MKKKGRAVKRKREVCFSLASLLKKSRPRWVVARAPSCWLKAGTVDGRGLEEFRRERFVRKKSRERKNTHLIVLLVHES